MSTLELLNVEVSLHSFLATLKSYILKDMCRSTNFKWAQHRFGTNFKWAQHRFATNFIWAQHRFASYKRLLFATAL